MRLRCPAKQCPIEVPDDLVGARIRCPHCGSLIVVDAKDCEGPSVQVQQGLPSGAPDPQEVSNLENQIYDGLPPLSVMMALRRRKGGPAYDQEELNRRYPMTEDDWKALAAFEKALDASAALTTAFWIGLTAFAANALLWAGMLGFNRSTIEEVSPARFFSIVATALAIGAGVTCIRAGTERLSRIMLGGMLAILPWCTLAMALVFGGTAAWNLIRMFSGEFRDDWLWLAAGLGAASSLLALVATSVAAVHVFGTLPKIRPPEIAHRLTEALKYLA
jgi:DNA-directed RNA polymerase subunit RPC12/RpoP